MVKISAKILVFTAIVAMSTFFAQAQDATEEVDVATVVQEDNVLLNDDGIEASTIKLTNGDKFVVFIMQETDTQLYVQNLIDDMEVTIPRSKIAEIRRPTAKEIEKQKKTIEQRKAQ